MSHEKMVEIPILVLPPIEEYETISIPLPHADVPFYAPLVVPPSDLEAPEGVELSLIHI